MPNAIALIHEEAGVYGISFPDFPGCISTAGSLDDAIARGGMALALHVEGMREDGEDLPVLRSATDIHRAVDIGDAVIAAVPVELPGRAVRVQITMDEHLLGALDRAAEASGSSRSGKIAEAVRDALSGRHSQRSAAEAGGSGMPSDEEILEMANAIIQDPNSAPSMIMIANFVCVSKAARGTRPPVGTHLEAKTLPRKAASAKSGT